ncbi:MAG: hypothetical protein WCP33_05135 [Deltaproteobacteria bacterium]
MNTDIDDRMDMLLAQARNDRFDTSLQEINFETRVMARIRERQEEMPWYAAAWRMIPHIAVLSAVIVLCSVAFKPSYSYDLFAAITNDQNDYLAKSILSGE